MIAVLRDNPLVLLFTVAAAGYLLGRIRIGGVRLGVAAVVFTGLAAGAVDPSLKLPEVVYLLGLVIFVYTVGLSSGAGFFSAFGRTGRDGLRDNLFALAVVVLAAGLAAAAHRILHLTPGTAAGVFAGSLTNTPALAGALDYLKAHVLRPAHDQVLVEPVVGYSMTYPAGVAGSIAAIYLARRCWPVDDAAAAMRLRHLGVPSARLESRTVRVTRPEASQDTIQGLIAAHGWDVVFGRIKRAERLFLALGHERLIPGDLVSVVGAADELDRVSAFLGEPSGEGIDLDRSEYDYRRILVSDPRVAGRRLTDLRLPQRLGALVTRVKRGDAEFIPHGDTALELGDRVRVLTARDRLDEVSAFFGDSYRAISEIDVMSFSLGLAAGLLLGLVPIPLPGGFVIRLGFAGGPLVVALVLGALERTGPLVWNIPYGPNLTLRQIGLILFLAGIGTRAGYAFVDTLTHGGAVIFLTGVCLTASTALATLWVGRRILRIPVEILLGMYAGIQTQPAALADV